MSKKRYHLRSTLLSALGFGLGFVVGGLLTYLIFRSGTGDSLLNLLETSRLLVGLSLILLISGLGGAVGGAIGGVTLSYAHQSTDRRGYAWRGALSFSLPFGLIAIPAPVLVSMLGFYEVAEVSPLALMVPLAVLGAIFGGLSGLVLGLLTVRRSTWRVVLTGLISFGIGGGLLGRSLFGYLLNQEDIRQAQWALFVGLFAFGVIGGGPLGFLYSWLAHRVVKPSLPARFGNWFKRQRLLSRVVAIAGLVVLLLALRTVWLISPFTAYSAPLHSTLSSNTIDTHWTLPEMVTPSARQPALAVNAAGVPALAWVEGPDVYYLSQQGPVNVSNSPAQSTAPQIAADDAGNAHLIWVEATADGVEIFYSLCPGATCTPPEKLSGAPACLTEVSPENSEPVLAVNANNTLLAVWRNGSGNLLYTIWPANTNPPDNPSGCLPLENAEQTRLAAGADNNFSLVFARPDEGQVYLTQFTNGGWATEPQLIGQGNEPAIFVDAQGQNHVGWCGSNQQVSYWGGAGQPPPIAYPRCTGRPGLAIGSDNLLRLVWPSDEVENVNGVVNPNDLLFESTLTPQGWSVPAIVAQTGGPALPNMATDGSGTLHLAWGSYNADPLPLNYATHTAYDCSGVELSDVGQAVYEIVRQEKYNPAGDPIPYCYNQFDRFMYVPNPVSAYTDAQPTPNGGFDNFAELAATAQYEVVFATMWYDSFNEAVNPGRVLGGGIAQLYQNLKDDPSRYPKGITVRILLGNPPKFALLPTFNSQESALIQDLYAAGVPEMRNDELGWNLEVARFSGSWPHSHTKLLVVDGKTVQSVGYNMQHTHLPTDHPSGKGKGRVDMGMQVTGPVAQTALRSFDELWQASTMINCEAMNSSLPGWWVFSCSAEPALADHVPEVLRYFVTNGNSKAFSVFRTEKFLESDDAYATALASAKESLDVIHINFSLEIICALNILVEACTYANRVEYMDGLMQAIEQNNVKTRILVSNIAWVGIENNIAIKAFEDELARRGLSDNVEIRYFEQDMHLKSALIDNQLLFLGSQNFHYSAWGGSESLAEFNVAVEDPTAIENYKRYFDYYWDRATPHQTE